MTGSCRMKFGAGPRPFRCPALFLAILLLLCAGPAASAAADFRITEIQACLPDCPPVLEQMKILLISDLHLSAGNRSRQLFTALTDRINLLKPDVLLIAGDIFDGRDKRDPELLADVWTEFMGRLERPALGVFAVLGNHDMSWGEGENIRAVLKKSGVRVLSGEVVTIRYRNASLYLAGTEKRPRKPFPKEFQKKITTLRPLILMAHYPETFDLVPDDAQILVVAGHTHGGVVHIPGLKDDAFISLFSPKHRTKYVFGAYGGQEGKRLYVTAGIGGEGKSGHRINNPPEIVIIRPGGRKEKITAPPRETAPAVPGEN